MSKLYTQGDNLFIDCAKCAFMMNIEHFHQEPSMVLPDEKAKPKR